MSIRVATAALLPLVLAGAGADAAKRDTLAGRVARPPVDCIDENFVSGPEIVDAHTILYRSPGKVYRAEVIGSCPALEPVSTLIVEQQFGRQICKDDRFRVLRQGETIPSNICRFGRFTPYVKPGK